MDPSIPKGWLQRSLNQARANIDALPERLKPARYRKGGKRKQARTWREAEQLTQRGLSELVAAKESGTLSETQELEANRLIEEGLALHREAAVRRRHAEAMAEAKAAQQSGNQQQMEDAAAALQAANADVRALIEVITSAPTEKGAP